MFRDLGFFTCECGAWAAIGPPPCNEVEARDASAGPAFAIRNLVVNAPWSASVALRKSFARSSAFVFTSIFGSRLNDD